MTHIWQIWQVSELKSDHFSAWVVNNHFEMTAHISFKTPTSLSLISLYTVCQMAIHQGLPIYIL